MLKGKFSCITINSLHCYNGIHYRLKDEVTVTKIIEQVLPYVEKHGDDTEVCRVYLRKIDHLYYKFDPNVIKKKEVWFLS